MKHTHNLLEVSLFGAIFFGIFELGASYSFYLLELSLILLAISILSCFIRSFGFHPLAWATEVANRLKLHRGVWLFLVAYLVWDCITLVYSPIPLIALTKYKVVLMMGAITVGMALYCKERTDFKRLLRLSAVAGVFTGIFAVLNIFLKVYPIYYKKRVSLRVDYNMFAVCVFTGFLVGILLLLVKKQSHLQKSVSITLLSCATIPIIVLSGSRRTFLLLMPTVVLFLLLWILSQKEKKKTILCAGVAVVAGVAITFLIMASIRYALASIGKENITGIGGQAGTVETDALERYESMNSGSLLQKRSAIWFSALDEIKTFDGYELLFGRGNGYDIYFYDIVNDARLNELYNMEAVKGAMSAHNFLIADMMNGGVLKLGISVMIWLLILRLMCSLLITKHEDETSLFRIKNIWVDCHGIIYSLVLGNTLINSLISNRFGFIYDRFFYIFLVLALLEATMREDERNHEES